MKKNMISHGVAVALGILIGSLSLLFLTRELPFLQRTIQKIQPVSSFLFPGLETTCAIIKPDAVSRRYAGDIIKLIELNNFEIKYLQKAYLSREQAENFYAVHKDRPFYNELVSYMTSGPVIIMALAKDNAVKEWRELMGATNPANAAPGTIRRMFGTDITHNATHGSDSIENASIELDFFFKK